MPPSSSLHVSPDGQRAALGLDTRLEICEDVKPLGKVAAFDYTIGALVWTDSSLLVAEGPLVHELDPATFEKPRDVRLFSTGVITALAVLPLDLAQASSDSEAPSSEGRSPSTPGTGRPPG